MKMLGGPHDNEPPSEPMPIEKADVDPWNAGNSTRIDWKKDLPF